ncbi:MAG: ribonuclease III domain-containing protein [Eubacteriales bacterium]|nr:ribonuclease III domain-containing protein [Eubacteriales bacterium]
MGKIDYLYINTTILAFMGDAVYEMHVREHLVHTGQIHGDKLHRAAVKYVRAEAQAEAIKGMLDILSQDELGLVKRARNKQITSKPKNADPLTYKWATALEALIGYLYLEGKWERMEEIIGKAMGK